MSKIPGRTSSSPSRDHFGRHAAFPQRRPGKTYRPGTEALECRALLSVVAVSTKGGNVTVTDPNAGDATLTVASGGAGAILISDANGISVNGGPTLAAAVVPLSKDLSFKLVSTDTLSFDEAAGPITVPGNLDVIGGGGDTVQTINPSTANALSVGKDLTITEQHGGGTVTLTDFQVKRNASIKNNDGTGATTNSTTLNVDGAPTANNSIGGDLTINNGKGTSTNSITDTSVGHNLSVNNDGASATTTVTFDGASPTMPVIKGDLSVKGKGANSVTISRLFAPGGGIGHNLNIDLGDADGDSVIVSTSIVSNDTSIKEGNGNGDVVQIFGSILNGKTDVDQGEGTNDTLAIFRANFGKDVNLQRGDGGGTTFITEAIFSGKTSIQTGNGDDSLNIGTAGDVTFIGEVQAQLGGGNDTLTLGTGGTVAFNRNALFDGQKGTNTKVVGAVATGPGATVKYKNFI